MKNPASILIGSIALSASAFAASGLTGTAIQGALGNDTNTLAASNLSLVVVDTAGDGFQFSSGGMGEGLDLSVGSYFGVDDLIVANNSTLVSFDSSAVSGTASINNGSNGIENGDAFAIVFFDGIADTANSSISSAFYGFATDATWLVPLDGQTYGFQSSPSGANYQQLSAVTAEFSIVPEVSTYALILGFAAMLGAMVRRPK